MSKPHKSVYFNFNINPLASPCAGAPALKYGYVNTEATSPGEVKGLKDWLEEEILDSEAMLLAIKGIIDLMEKEEKFEQKLTSIENEIKKVEAGGSSFKTLFQKKDNVINKMKKEKEETKQKLENVQLLVKILMDNMEKQINDFKGTKTHSYYKNLKIFAILQKESNKVIKELWDIIKISINQIAPDASKSNEEYLVKPMSQEDNIEVEQIDGDED